MMEFLLGKMRSKGVKQVLLEVKTTNEPAIALYRGFGFRPLLIRRAYYADGSDAIVMLKEMGNEDADVRKP